jgi:indole-3-glycerol phosphate synthase
VHDEEEAARAARVRPALVGVNNRDLQTFAVRLETSEALAPLLPTSAVRVSESGLFTSGDCERLARCGYQAFLVGEALVKDPDPAGRVRALRGSSAAH